MKLESFGCFRKWKVCNGRPTMTMIAARATIAVP
jgi:hypothetical protein